MAGDASYDNDGTAPKTSGTLTYDPDTLTLTWTGDLAPGARATITYYVTVNKPGRRQNPHQHRHLNSHRRHLPARHHQHSCRITIRS